MAGVIGCNADREQWMLLKKREGPYTCIVGDDLSVIRSSLEAPACSYEALPRRDSKVALPVRATQIRVTGHVTARISWEHAGELQLIVETNARVFFYSRNKHASLVVSVRNQGELTLSGRFHSVVSSVDDTSRIDATHSRCSKGLRVDLKAAGVVPVAFPHRPADCTPVTDDTPSERQCGTCLERIKNAVFSPCGHEYMCVVCADRYQRTAVHDFTCPLCRAPIKAVTLR